jgi:hypothetical protein
VRTERVAEPAACRAEAGARDGVSVVVTVAGEDDAAEVGCAAGAGAGRRRAGGLRFDWSSGGDEAGGWDLGGDGEGGSSSGGGDEAGGRLFLAGGALCAWPSGAAEASSSGSGGAELRGSSAGWLFGPDGLAGCCSRGALVDGEEAGTSAAGAWAPLLSSAWPSAWAAALGTSTPATTTAPATALRRRVSPATPV